MSLIRNSLLVAVGTTVAGIGLMELFSSTPTWIEKKPKPSWYYQATLLTGIAGGMGYALVNNRYTPDAFELTTIE